MLVLIDEQDPLFKLRKTKQMPSGLGSRRMRFISIGSSGMRLTLAFLTLFGLYQGLVDAQRLSQGASDWYMRFYSNMDYVKRNVDGPVTKSFVVSADIQYRYATTMVTTVVHNPANVAQNYTFGFVMPKEAFVSNVSIVRQPSGAGVDQDAIMNAAGVENIQSTQGQVRMSSELFSQIANQASDDDDKNEALQSQDWIQLGLPFHQFVLPVSLGANDEARITLTYEQMLSKKEENYNYVVSLSPGERVDDFQVRLSIVDERNLGHVKITAPVIGTIADQEVVAMKEYQHRFNMTLVDQALNFGRHGFTGDLVMQFSLEEDLKELDIVVEDDTFVHFYHGPAGDMESIPVHVLFLFDTSMSQDKLTMGKEAFSTLMRSLTEKDLFNLALFNGVYGKSIEHWNIGEESTRMAYAGTEENAEKVIEFIDNMEVSGWNSTTNYILEAIEENVALFQDLSGSGSLPANAFSRIVLLTDGRLGETENRPRLLRLGLETKSVPLTIIGIGSEANMAHLERIANGDDDLIENVIEDAPVEHQLDAVVKHLHDVILKDLELSYLDQEGEVIPVTHHQYKFLKRGSDIVVSGQANDMLQNLKAVEIKGQMANGEYSRRVSFLATPQHLGCNGNITLCSLPAFQGKCLTFNSSITRLNPVKFHKKAVSAMISGTCSWLVFTKRNFKGKKAQLLPGAHEVLPGSLYQSIASLQVAHPLPEQLEEDKTSLISSIATNPLHHHYSYLKIKHALIQDSDQAYEAAMQQHFLTPYTHLEFKQSEGQDQIVAQSIVTFKDLSPIFFQVNDPELEQLEALRQCEKPVECQDNFHFEVYEGDIINDDDVEDKCNNGSLSLYTRPSGEGESLEISQSLSQIYHATNGGRMHSFTSVGNCCWLIFNHGFFKGKVNKVCGDTIQNLWKENIGSVKKIAFQAVRK